jgi:hypothetical protein
MGRPLKKKLFSANTNNNIKVQFHNGTTSKQGYIVKQVGARRFKCRDAAGNTRVCKLVNKAAGSLLAGEMSITVKQDDTTVDQVLKISGRMLTTISSGGLTIRRPWNFSTSTSDGYVQVEEAGTSTTTISTATGAVNLEGDVET